MLVGAGSLHITATKLPAVVDTSCSFNKNEQVRKFNMLQFCETEDTEEDVCINKQASVNETTYSWLHLYAFEVHRHFLIYFAAAIKNTLPQADILFCHFRI